MIRALQPAVERPVEPPDSAGASVAGVAAEPVAVPPRAPAGARGTQGYPETGGLPAREYHARYGGRVPFFDLTGARPGGKAHPEAELLGLPFPPRARTGFRADRPEGVGDLLALAYGVTRIDWNAHGIRAGRPVPSGGAAYPAEVYLAAGFGLCHYLPTAHALERLERADRRGAVVECLQAPPAAAPELVLVLTARHAANLGVFGAFGHRLQALDSGVLAGQSLALFEAAGAQARLHTSFDAARLGALLGLDPALETVRAVITAGAGQDEPLPVPAFSTDPGALWAGLPRRVMARHTVREGFEPISVPLQRIREILEAAAAPVPSDLRAGPGQACAGLELYCLAQRVDGLASACHRRDPESGEFSPVRASAVDARTLFPAGSAGELARFQASCALLVAGDYEHGYQDYGESWYRMLNLSAGILAQRIGIAATAAGLGCSVRCDYQGAVADRLIQAQPGRTVLVLALIGLERGAGAPGHRLLLGG